ncbi:MAG: type IV secretion protein IcmD [Gammaproteobacteria bacterium]|nr:type IV secretion protein IcmD [Gammaproteobacteria bacterium]
MTMFSRMFALGLALVAPIASAADTSSGIGAMASQLQSQFAAITTMITGGAYLAGIAIFLSGLFKMKAWKDNPQSNPLSTAVTFMVTGILLVYLPNFLGTAGASLFASGSTAGIGGSTSLG